MRVQPTIKKQLSQPIVWLAGLISAVGLSMLIGAIYHSRYVRYLADDYCTAGIVQNLGWLSAQSYWYTTWTGRFSFVAIVSGLELLGPMVAAWLPLIIALIWLIGLVWFGWRLGQLAGYRHAWLPALPLSLLTVAMFVITNPQPGQAFFWFTGNITYTLPLVICTYVAVMAVHLISQARQVNFSLNDFWSRWPVRLNLIASSLLLIVASGLNETHAVAQVLVLALLGLGLLIVGISNTSYLKCLLPVVGIWFIASLAGLYVVAQAPGNDVRAALYPPHPTIEKTINESLHDINSYLAIDWMYPWFIYLMVASVLLLSLTRRAKSSAALTTQAVYKVLCNTLLIGVIAYGLIITHYAPSYYVQHYATEARTYAAVSFILAIAAIAIGGQLSQLVRPFLYSTKPHLATISTVILLIVGAALIGKLYLSQHTAVWQQVSQMQSSWQTYAQSWDERHRQLQQQAQDGQTMATIQRLGQTYNLEDINLKADHWINQCVAQYYGLDQVIAE